jgi:sulfotransferase family protein
MTEPRHVPNLFIVGAPKSGTTSLYEYLKGHPQAFLPEVKEPCYFAADLAFDKSGGFMRYGVDEDLYYALFAGAGDAKAVGEGSTRYLYSRDAPALIHSVAPGARIVAMLRNPVDMIHSLHAHKLAAGTEDIADFEQALAAENDRRAGLRIPPQSNPKLATYRDRALFGKQLEHWLATFDRDQVRVIVFEDMVADPARHFEELLEFLGIDADYRPASFAAHNVAHGARSPLARRMLGSRPAQWMAWRLLPRIVGDVRAREWVRRFSQSGLRRRKAPRTSISPELRRRLQDEFRPDVQRLSGLLGRDMVEFWFGRPPVSAPDERGSSE